MVLSDMQRSILICVFYGACSMTLSFVNKVRPPVARDVTAESAASRTADRLCLCLWVRASCHCNRPC